MRWISLIIVLAFIMANSAISCAAEKARLTLDDCIRLANEYEPTLKSKEARVEFAHGEVVTARAGFLPSIDGEAELRRYLRRPGFQAPGGRIFNVQTVPQVSAQLNQKIFDLGTFYNYRGARIGEEVERTNVDLYRQDLAVNVVKVYFGVLLAEKGLTVAKASKRSLGEYYREVTHMYGQGEVTKNDLLTADVALAQAGLDVERARNDVDVARLRFQTVVGIPPDGLDEAVFKQTPIPKDPEALKETAFKQRLELDINDKLRRRANARKREAASAYVPDLYAFAKAEWMRDNVEFPEGQGTLGVGLSWPIFDGLASAGKRQSAIAQHRALGHQRNAIENRIAVEVEQAFDDLKLAQRSIEVERKNRAQALENLRIQKQLYANGDSTSYDVLQAQAMWTGAQTAYYRSIYDFNVSRARLNRAIGAPVEGI